MSRRSARARAIARSAESGVCGTAAPPTPNPSPPRASRAGGGERRRMRLWSSLQPQPHDPHHAVGHLLVAIDARGHAHEDLAMVEIDDRAFVEDELGELLEH